MITSDDRQIISGFYSTEEERKACLTEEQWLQWKELEKQISERDTGSKNIVRGKNQDQHSIIGSPGDLNPWGHSEGTIGNTIDYCVQLGIFTKEQIRILAGTRINKINSHLRSMKNKGLYNAIEDENGILSFKDEQISIRESFQKLLDTYIGGKNSGVYGKNSPVWRIFKNAEKSIQNCTTVSKRQGLKVYGSAGQGNWAAVPWIGFFDERITTKSSEGLNCGISFCADMSGVCLSLGQGVDNLIKELGRSVAISQFEERKVRYRKRVGLLKEYEFQLDDLIDLKRNDSRASSNDKANIIAYKIYKKDKLPPDYEIEYDINVLLTIYQKLAVSKDNTTSIERNVEKNDSDLAVKMLHEQGIETTVEKILDQIEEIFTSKGIALKSNWRIITERNIREQWYS